jgi:hypothetical protein
MIFKTDFTRGDSLAKHLARTDTNTRVLIREDLSQGVPLDLAFAVPFLGGFAATNPRAVRRVIHGKWSPANEHAGSERLILDLACERLGIRPDAPRIVAQHSKPHADGTDRPDHFHVVWPLVDVDTGRAVRSHEAPLADELISRLAEVALGEPITPGVRHREVVAILRKEGRTAIADQLSQYPAAHGGERMTTGARRSLQRAGFDPKSTAPQLLDCWRAAGGEAAAFVAKARDRGFEIRRGEKVILAVHLASEVPIPLRRALNEASKAGGDALRLKKDDCDDLFGDLPGHVGKQERRDAAMLEADRKKTDDQLILLGREALGDGDSRAAARAFGAAATRRLNWEAERRQDYRTIAAERRSEQGRAKIVEQHRVKRAFRHAGIFSDRRLRRLAVIAAAAGAVLAGGGLGAAMIAGGIAIAAIPTYERARAVAFIERRDRLARYQRDRGVLMQHRIETKAVQAKQTIALDGRGDNLLAGAYLELLIRQRLQGLNYYDRELKRALRTALRKSKADMLEALGRKADAAAVGKVLGCRPMRSNPDRRAVAQVLRDRFQTAAADSLDPVYAWIRDISMSMPACFIDDRDSDVGPTRRAAKPTRGVEISAERRASSGAEGATLQAAAGLNTGRQASPISQEAPRSSAVSMPIGPAPAVAAPTRLASSRSPARVPTRGHPSIHRGKGFGD